MGPDRHTDTQDQLLDFPLVRGLVVNNYRMSYEHSEIYSWNSMIPRTLSQAKAFMLDPNFGLVKKKMAESPP